MLFGAWCGWTGAVASSTKHYTWWAGYLLVLNLAKG